MANNSNRKAIEFMVVSPLPPHSTNVLWMDTSIPGTPVLKIFMDGAWAGIWTTVRTEDERSLELLTQVILEQHGLISELTDEVKAVCNATNTKVTALTSTSAKESTSQSILQAVENIDIDTSDLAKEATLGTSSDTSVSTTIFGWLKSIRDFLVGIVTTNPYAKEASVKDGNDTAISVSKSVYGALTDNTNGLSAIKNAIPTVANIQNGLATSSALSSVATDVSNAASDAAAAKVAAQAITGYALQGNDPTATNTAILQAIPNVSGLATEINATANKNAIIAKIQANAGVPILTIPDSTASQELAPNVLYVFNNRTSRLTLTLGTPVVGKANEYHFFVVCGSTAPTIIFPSGITWNGGAAPNIIAGTTYEISILNNVAAYFRV